MHRKNRFAPKFGVLIACGVLAVASVSAQETDEEAAARKSSQQQTKQAQAVSKEVYDRITKAQEAVDAKDYPGALKLLNALYNPDELTE
jgi:hypothetical protein